jgi:glycosylphosphatidylinositol transamidase
MSEDCPVLINKFFFKFVQKYTGKNVYAILRAPRSSSTEALVLSVPYRPPSSIHPGTAPSIAVMLAVAKFFRRKLHTLLFINWRIDKTEKLMLDLTLCWYVF